MVSWSAWNLHLHGLTDARCFSFYLFLASNQFGCPRLGFKTGWERCIYLNIFVFIYTYHVSYISMFQFICFHIYISSCLYLYLFIYIYIFSYWYFLYIHINIYFQFHIYIYTRDVISPSALESRWCEITHQPLGKALEVEYCDSNEYHVVTEMVSKNTLGFHHHWNNGWPNDWMIKTFR